MQSPAEGDDAIRVDDSPRNVPDREPTRSRLSTAFSISVRLRAELPAQLQRHPRAKLEERDGRNEAGNEPPHLLRVPLSSEDA